MKDSFAFELLVQYSCNKMALTMTFSSVAFTPNTHSGLGVHGRCLDSSYPSQIGLYADLPEQWTLILNTMLTKHTYPERDQHLGRLPLKELA